MRKQKALGWETTQNLSEKQPKITTFWFDSIIYLWISEIWKILASSGLISEVVKTMLVMHTHGLEIIGWRKSDVPILIFLSCSVSVQNCAELQYSWSNLFGGLTHSISSISVCKPHSYSQTLMTLVADYMKKLQPWCMEKRIRVMNKKHEVCIRTWALLIQIILLFSIRQHLGWNTNSG